MVEQESLGPGDPWKLYESQRSKSPSPFKPRPIIEESTPEPQSEFPLETPVDGDYIDPNFAPNADLFEN